MWLLHTFVTVASDVHLCLVHSFHIYKLRTNMETMTSLRLGIITRVLIFAIVADYWYVSVLSIMKLRVLANELRMLMT